jgi:hypothetical protein
VCPSAIVQPDVIRAETLTWSHVSAREESAMKPTAYILFGVGLVLAASAALLFMNSYSAFSSGVHGEPGRSSTLVIALFAAAAGTAAFVWAMLRFGGKGYTETNSPLRR